MLSAITLIAYGPVWDNDFVNYDDNDYVTENLHVQEGLTAAGFRWAWTTTETANWHPLTWLSLMLDAQLFGLSARAFHATNLLLHLANTLLLYSLLQHLTGAAWRSFFVAALFAVHPLHVESVAWVSERKDVLSTFFGLLALGAYARYARSPSGIRYALVALALALSLLAKPMLVTLPLLMLLLDYWPLERWQVAETGAGWSVPLRRLLLEKMPLLALSAASCVVTIWAQWKGGAVNTLAHISLSNRLGNALVSYMQYLRQTVLPLDLSVFYPYHGAFPGVGELAAAVLLLGGMSYLAWWGKARFSYLPVGWLWYVGTLVPVIGLVQVGSQARADRYTYVPLIGIFVLAIWGLADLFRRWQQSRLPALFGAAVLSYFMLLSWTQVHYWHNSLTLWLHALKLDSDNFIAHYNLGEELLRRGDFDTAVRSFREAVRLVPNDRRAHEDLAAALAVQGKWTEAAHHFREVLQLQPERADLHRHLGLTLMLQGQWAEASTSFRRAADLRPENAEYHHSLAYTLNHLGQAAARSEYEKALRLDPSWPSAYMQLAWSQATDPNPQRRMAIFAVVNAEKVQQAIGDEDEHVLDVLGAAYAEAGRYPEAVTAAEKALVLARAHGQSSLAGEIEARLLLYKQSRPYRTDRPYARP